VTLARIGDFARSQFPFVARVARAAMDAVSRPQFPLIVRQFRAAMKAITKPRRKGSGGFGSIDPTAAGRAAAASAAVSARYEGLIEEISRNPGLTPEQRAAAIRGLRQQQSAEAGAAHKRIMDEARAAARVRREMEKGTP
jgi:hypothetical protein